LTFRHSTVARFRAATAIAYAIVACVTLGIGLQASTNWVGRTFPGFFLMPNRVVPSVALDHWTAGRGPTVYQRQVIAIDDAPIASADEAYDVVATRPPGTGHVYRFSGDPADPRRGASMLFTRIDYFWFFGPLIANGIVFTVAGLMIWLTAGASAATTGGTLLCLNIGLFCLTALELYGPGHLFRIHVATEAAVAATLLHFTLVFPLRRFGRARRLLTGAIYLALAGVVFVYQRYLDDPTVYSRVHNLCMVFWGVSGACFAASALQAYLTTTSALVRKRLGIIALGVVVGLAVPAFVLTWSGISGGEVDINLAAFTAFVFPLSLFYAVGRHDLFEVDAMLRRGVSSVMLTAIVAVLYALVVTGSGFALQTADPSRSPVTPVIFSVLMITLFDPVRTRIHRSVDRLFHRSNHDPQKTLRRASSALVATFDLGDIYRLAISTPCEALVIDSASLWMRTTKGAFELVERIGTTRPFRGPFPPGDRVTTRLHSAQRAITVYDNENGEISPEDAALDRRAFTLLGAQVVIPIGAGEMQGFLALGPKRSHAIYTLSDLDFLRTYVNQVAVAVENARSYSKIEELNVSLEQKVARRTSELGETNRELANSISALERAYDETRQRQDDLVRAERMAALGRLTAGIAHEVNTPLGACMNALKSGTELVAEYRSSIGDRDVSPDDHREIAGELQQILDNVSKWTDTAAGYIRSIKGHARSLPDVERTSVALRPLLEDTRVLLAHRLRLSSCVLTISCAESIVVVGDAGRLGQVVTNLITNAIDAYEDHQDSDCEIRLTVSETPEDVQIAVEDDGSGIAPDKIPHLFDELFTTKAPGKGTGLGLSLCRNLLLEAFGGTVEVESTLGKGSRFVLVLPRRDEPTHDHDTSALTSTA